jgi:hypothetical protein
MIPEDEDGQPAGAAHDHTEPRLVPTTLRDGVPIHIDFADELVRAVREGRARLEPVVVDGQIESFQIVGVGAKIRLTDA